MNYEEDVKIDPSQLDVEWLEQSRLMVKYTKLQAVIQRDEDTAKEKLEFVSAELDQKIRKNPEKFGIDKITENVIKNTILLNDEYSQVNTEYIDAKFENNTAKGAVRAVDTKKTALENLVKLHGQQYFAGPRSPRDISQEWEKHEQQKRVDSKIGKKLNRTRTRKDK